MRSYCSAHAQENIYSDYHSLYDFYCTNDTARAEALIKSVHATLSLCLKLAPKRSHVNTVAGLANDDKLTHGRVACCKSDT